MAHCYSKESCNRIALFKFLKNLNIGIFHPDLFGLSSLQKSKNQEYFTIFYRLNLVHCDSHRIRWWFNPWSASAGLINSSFLGCSRWTWWNCIYYSIFSFIFNLNLSFFWTLIYLSFWINLLYWLATGWVTDTELTILLFRS